MSMLVFSALGGYGLLLLLVFFLLLLFFFILVETENVKFCVILFNHSAALAKYNELVRQAILFIVYMRVVAITTIFAITRSCAHVASEGNENEIIFVCITDYDCCFFAHSSWCSHCTSHHLSVGRSTASSSSYLNWLSISMVLKLNESNTFNISFVWKFTRRSWSYTWYYAIEKSNSSVGFLALMFSIAWSSANLPDHCDSITDIGRRMQVCINMNL